MFERFTERARQTVTLAQEAAQARNDHEIDDDHILLGLLREEESLAARVLELAGVTNEKVVSEMQARRGAGSKVWREGEQIPFAVGGKKALELGLREALGLGHNYIGTEHLLLAVSRVDGRGAAILRELGMPNHELRLAVMTALRGPGASKTPELLELLEVARQALAPVAASLLRAVADRIER